MAAPDPKRTFQIESYWGQTDNPSATASAAGSGGGEEIRLNWQRKPLVAEKGATAELPSGPVEPKVRDTFLTAIGVGPT